MKKINLNDVLNLNELENPEVELSPGEFSLVIYEKGYDGTTVMKKEVFVVEEEELNKDNILIKNAIKSKRNFKIYIVKCESYEATYNGKCYKEIKNKN